MLLLYITSFTIYSWGEVPERVTSSEAIDEPAVANGVSGLDIIAYGNLMGIDNSRSRPDAPVESQTDMATYAISEIVQGTLGASQIRIIYSTITAKSPLPESAILLLYQYSTNASVYAPLGREAWRGILPDTPENRARIQAASPEELSATTPGDELSEADALQIAQQALADHSDYVGYSGKHKITTIRRMPFGWFFGVDVLDERGGESVVEEFTIQINDEGELVTIYHLPFKSLKSADQW